MHIRNGAHEMRANLIEKRCEILFQILNNQNMEAILSILFLLSKHSYDSFGTSECSIFVFWFALLVEYLEMLLESWEWTHYMTTKWQHLNLFSTRQSLAIFDVLLVFYFFTPLFTSAPPPQLNPFHEMDERVKNKMDGRSVGFQATIAKTKIAHFLVPKRPSYYSLHSEVFESKHSYLFVYS